MLTNLRSTRIAPYAPRKECHLIENFFTRLTRAGASVPATKRSRGILFVVVHVGAAVIWLSDDRP